MLRFKTNNMEGIENKGENFKNLKDSKVLIGFSA